MVWLMDGINFNFRFKLKNSNYYCKKMSTSSPALPVVAIIISILVGIHYYDEMTNSDIMQQSSDSLKQWHGRGQFYAYKQLHNIFYVHDEVNANYDATLVLLHGFPTSSYDYSKLWPLLRQLKVKSIVTFDYLGYGFSEKPHDYDYNVFDMADMVDALLVHLNIVDNVHFISHDVGDSVLQELLRRDSLKNQNHFKIAKAVMLNGGIISEVYKPTMAQDMLRTKFVNILFANHFFKYPFVKSSFSSIFGTLGKPNDAELYDFFLTIKYNEGQLNLPKTIRYMTEREQYGRIWYDALNETTVPSLFIYGPADPINPREKFIGKFKADLPGVKLAVLSDLVGHYPQFEDPFTVFEIVKNFFKL